MVFNCTIESSELHKRLWAVAPEIITEPYTPSLAVRYPKIAGLTVAGLTYALGTVISDKTENSSVLTSTISLVTAILVGYYVTNRRSVTDLILTDPVYLLAWNRKLHEKIISKMKFFSNEEEPKNSEENLNHWKQLINQCARKNPIFLLEECDTGNDWFCCLMSRSINARYRHKFEELVKDELLSKSESLKRAVNYVSFGCGGLLQDLIILTKALAAKPTMHVNIHLIDLKFFALAVFLDRQHNSRIVDLNTAFEVNEPALKECVAYLNKVYPGVFNEKTSDDEAMIDLKCSLYSQYGEVKQFGSWLQKTFPKTQLSFAVHNMAEEYLIYIQEKKLLAADIVVAADIEDEMSMIKGSFKDYGNLCGEMFKKNSSVVNMWLSKTDDQASACIRTFSLQPVNGQKQREIKGTDGGIVYMNELSL